MWAGRFDGERIAGRWWMVGCAALLFAAAMAAAANERALPRSAQARPSAAEAEPSELRPIARVGGVLSGLAADGDAVYIGEGPDVVALRADADGQLTVVHRTPLPEIVTRLAIAPEADRLYAVAGDTVYALSVADRVQPMLLAGVAVPLQPGSNIVARGAVVYARLALLGAGEERCVAAVSFDGAPARGTVGPAVCATDLVGGFWDGEVDRLTLGDGVLAAYAGPYLDDSVPDISLWDVRDPARPRFRRSLVVDEDVLQAELAGTRLWVLEEEMRAARAYDVSNLDAAPVRVAEATLPGRNPIDRVFGAEGAIWLVTHASLSAVDPDATGALQATKVRWLSGCVTASPPNGQMTATRDALLALDSSVLSLCRIPPDEAHITYSSASSYIGSGWSTRVAAAEGRAFASSGAYGWMQLVHGGPAALVRLGSVTLPPIVRGGATRHVAGGAFDADARHLVAAQADRLAIVRLPVADDPTLAAEWTIPPAADERASSAIRVRVAGDHAALLRPTDLHVVDVTRPDAPAAVIADRWRSGRALAVDAGRAAVLAGGYDRGADPIWYAPHVVIVGLGASPPAVLGELTLGDRMGWEPVGIAWLGDHVVVALTRPSDGTPSEPRGAGEVVVIDAAAPSAPVVVGRAAIGGETDVEIRTIAARPATAGGLAIVGGVARPAREPDAPPGWGPPPYRGQLWVVDVSVPSDPVVRAALDAPGRPVDIAIDGRTVLVAATEGGLQRFDLVLPGDVPAAGWRLGLPWLGAGARALRGEPIPRRATALPRPTSPP